MAANALKEQGLPFLKQLETLGGIKLAMPFQPSMGPGTFYTILVSEIISDKEKQAWKIFAWILLFGAAIFLVVIVARYFNL